MANALAKYGMEYDNVHGPFNHINDMWFDTEAGEAMYQKLTECLDQCAEVNAKAMVVHLSSGLKAPAISEICQARYQGPLTLEVIAKNSNRYDDITPDEYLEKAAVAIKRLVNMIDA